MAGFAPVLFFLAAALAASACAAAPAGVASPSWRIGPHHHARVPALRPSGVAPQAVFRHQRNRHAVLVLPVVTTYVVIPAPVPSSAPVVAAPYPYDVAPPAYAGDELGHARTRNWNWTPVESVVALAGGGKLRSYCTELGAYYPEVEACPSPWLKVLP